MFIFDGKDENFIPDYEAIGDQVVGWLRAGVVGAILLIILTFTVLLW